MKISMRQFDDLLDQWHLSDGPGCSSAVIQDGSMIYSRGVGKADLSKNTEIVPSTLFQIASMYKQFVAMGIALLSVQERLSLDNSVRAYLPELPAFCEPVTVRHLLYHTSGIRDYDSLASLLGLDTDQFGMAEILDLICRSGALNFNPGEKTVYSNSGYMLLREIIQRIVGCSFSEWATDTLFAPLGMNHTFCSYKEIPDKKQAAMGYTMQDDNTVAISHLPEKVGGLWTSTEDLLYWDQNFYDNRLGGGQDLMEAFHACGNLNDGTLINYAFGIEVQSYKGYDLFWHGGARPGFKSAMIRMPSKHSTVIALFNTDRPPQAPFDFCKHALELLLEDAGSGQDMCYSTGGVSVGGAGGRPSRHPVANLDRQKHEGPSLLELEGDYFCKEINLVYRLMYEDGHIYVRFQDNERSPFDSPLRARVKWNDETVYRKDQFQLRRGFTGSDVAFVRDDQGEIIGFDLNTPRVTNLRFLRIC